MFGYLYQKDFFKNGILYVLNPIDKQYYGGKGAKNIQERINVMSQSYDDDHFPMLGFWIYSEKGLDIQRAEMQDEGQDQNSLKQLYGLYSGWNLIGISSVMVGQKIVDFKGDCDIKSSYFFNPVNQSWESSRSDGFENELLEDSMKGYGIAINVGKDCQFDFENNSNSGGTPPALPN